MVRVRHLCDVASCTIDTKQLTVIIVNRNQLLLIITLLLASPQLTVISFFIWWNNLCGIEIVESVSLKIVNTSYVGNGYPLGQQLLAVGAEGLARLVVQVIENAVAIVIYHVNHSRLKD